MGAEIDSLTKSKQSKSYFQILASHQFRCNGKSCFLIVYVVISCVIFFSSRIAWSTWPKAMLVCKFLSNPMKPLHYTYITANLKLHSMRLTGDKCLQTFAISSTIDEYRYKDVMWPLLATLGTWYSPHASVNQEKFHWSQWYINIGVKPDWRENLALCLFFFFF